MDRIVVGVDGSEPSIEALRWAAVEGQRWDALVEAAIVVTYPVTPVGVLGPMIETAELEANAAAILDGSLRVAFPADPMRSRIHRDVLVGGPAEALCHHAKGADLLVVGSRGRGGFRGLLLGSVSNQCAQHAPCPVVIIRSTHAPSEV